MNSFLGKIKDLVSRHRILSMICLLALVIIIILMYIFSSIFTSNGNNYGDRLRGIKDVEIAKSKLSSVSDKIKENSEVIKASVRVQGKIVYLDIEFNADTSLDKAKEIANSSLDNFSDKEKKFYDFEYILYQKKDDNTGFKITGTKGPKTDGISFIKS